MDLLNINNFSNIDLSNLNQIEKVKFDLQEDTFYLEIKDLKKEFLYSNLTILSVNKYNKIIFFSSHNKENVLIELRRIINDSNIPYFIICTRNNINSDKIGIIDLLIKIFDFKFIKFQKLDLFWYGIVINSSNKYILEEKILDLGCYELEKQEYNSLVNQEYIKKKEELDETIKVLKENCKNLTIDKIFQYKQIIDNNMKELENKKKLIECNYSKIENKMNDIVSLGNRDLMTDKIELLEINKTENLELELEKDILLENNENKLDSIFEEFKNEEFKNEEFKNEELNNNFDEIEDIDIISKELHLFLNKKEKRNFAVMVHLYKIDVWEDLYQYIENLYNFGVKFDLYINIAIDNEDLILEPEYQELLTNLDEINVYENFYLTYSDNRGMDIGGFMTSYIKMLDLGLSYQNIIKIHSKTNFNWRFCMLYSLLGNEKIIKKNMEIMGYEKTGMLGNNKISISDLYVNSNRVIRYIDKYNDYFNIKNRNSGEFIPGTIFWIKGDILDNYFTKDNLKELYEEMPKYYCGSKENNKEGLPHGFERFFGILVNEYGKETYSYKD